MTTQFFITNPALTLISILLIGVMPNDVVSQSLQVDETTLSKWKEYEEFAAKLQGKSQYQEEIVSGEKRRNVEQVTYIQQNSQGFLRRYHRSAETEESIYLGHSQYYAELSREVTTPSKVILVGFQYRAPTGAPLPPRWERPLSNDVFESTSPHFCYRGERLSRMISNPSFKIISLKQCEHESANTVQMEFNYARQAPHERISRDGTLFLNPERCWCIQQIQEVERVYRKGSLLRTAKFVWTFATAKDVSGYPIIEQTKRTIDGVYEADKRRVKATQTGTYDLKVDEGVPDSVFTLSAFNLPEPVGVQWDKPIPTYVWLLIATVTAGLLAFGFRMLARRPFTSSK